MNFLFNAVLGGAFTKLDWEEKEMNVDEKRLKGLSI